MQLVHGGKSLLKRGGVVRRVQIHDVHVVHLIIVKKMMVMVIEIMMMSTWST